MAVCEIAGCPALATKGARCAIHGVGYLRADGTELRCSKCGTLFRNGEWYQRTDTGQIHAAKTCEQKNPAA